MVEDRETKGGLDEYREIGVNWRYWGDVRFKQMTVYFTATGALIAAAFSSTVRNAGAGALHAGAATVLTATLGVALTVTFLLLEERATFYRRAFMSCARVLEGEIGLPRKAYARTHSPISADSGGAYRFLLSVMMMIWTTTPFASLEHQWIGLVVGLVVGLVFFAVAQKAAQLAVEVADARGTAPLPLTREHSVTLRTVLRALFRRGDVRPSPAPECHDDQAERDQDRPDRAGHQPE